MKDAIKSGDTVDVHFETDQSEFGVEVVYTPSDVGDDWIFRRKDGTVIHVMRYSKIVKRAKGE